MLRAALSLRYLMLVASFGAVLGALLMFYEAVEKLVGGFAALLSHDESKSVVAAVMGATDSSLFGIVLMFFAYAIAFGFVVELRAENRERLPRWMRVESISDLKHTLIEVILVYLVVDFATDVANSTTHQNWETLIMPVAILLLAGALWLMKQSEVRGDRAE
jgi:uncharacterized membrane protein YqhA